jgi:hypothetical protein
MGGISSPFSDKKVIISIRDGSGQPLLPFACPSPCAIVDGVAKSPPYGVTAFFQDLDIPDVCLRP